MLKTGFYILMIFNFSVCCAQADSTAKSPFKNFDFKLTYLSSVIYPGVSIGIEYFIKQKSLDKSKLKPGNKILKKERFISGNLNWYHHPDFHDNLYLTLEWVKRKTKSTGFISEFTFGPGFSRTFNGGTTYTVSDNGMISVVKSAGYNYALFTVGEGIGYDFSVNKQRPYSVFAKGNMILMFPYNSTIYLRPVLEIGLRFMPDRRKRKICSQIFSISNL